ncbi:MAG: V-type ATP synthase subunit F [Clostridiales bacterium GWF2_38_85]|nr:MAG: V-type ATP synthase subunit F [Clostridiales bacterium GWF2_38_85]HBL83494.1 V-type ATP synthase subunit F [Clostridiales bacterium]
MSKIGIIGDKYTILSFNAVGVTIHATSDVRDASRTIAEWAKEEYSIIFLTEQLAENMNETIDVYKSKTTPAIILIPGNSGSLGIGLENIILSVEKAIGTNIL